MGEQRSESGFGHRVRGGPGAAGPPGPAGTPPEALLAAALRARPAPGTEAERRALAAFRATWEQGVRRPARTRRRDDWRPRRR
ncbi:MULTISPECIES: hypothetical protein [unclassified Streptomyces]|uniref:hypothetical protein n=1 Tax=unclassified Streptomyces TaxID=2593676 RepID=UPI001C1FBB08|nr:hypothetical protein [Streptomyces sp. SAT1]